MRLGPVALAFSGTARYEEADGVALRATVKAQGADTKGRGGASASSRFQLEPSPAGTRVAIVTDLNLSGSVAQHGRGAGMIQEAAAQLIRQFADNLRAEISRAEAASPAKPAVAEAAVASGAAAASLAPPPPSPAKPISGFSMMLRVLWNSIRRFFRRVPGH